MSEPCHPSYHSKFIENAARGVLIYNVGEYLRENPDVVGIAGSGISGIPIVGIISHLMNLIPIYVRRDGETSNDGYYKAVTPIEIGVKMAGRYVILDDTIDTGETVNRIIRSISRFDLFGNSEPLDILLYNDCGTHEKYRDIGLPCPVWYVGNDKWNRRNFGYTPEKRREWINEEPKTTTIRVPPLPMPPESAFFSQEIIPTIKHSLQVESEAIWSCGPIGVDRIGCAPLDLG